jgi:uncharacterized membrane protein YqjE
MAGEPMRFRNPAGHRGLLGSLLAAVNTFIDFLESRFELIAQESKTALVDVIVLVGCLLAAGLFCVLAIVLLLIAAIVAVANALQVSWLWVALGFALLLIVVALVCVLIARARMKRPMFQVTAAELKKDREWLKNLGKTSHSTR